MPLGSCDIKPLQKSSSLKLMDLNAKSLRAVLDIMKDSKLMQAQDIVIEYFTNLITEGKQSSARRQLTIETINRYVFCLNQVIFQGHISLVDLRNDIKNILEKGKGFEIDKKTLKRIVDKLLKDNLVKTVNFKVTV